MADKPSTITAGDSATWTETVSDYPASAGWSFAYKGALIGGAAGTAPISISSSGSGSVFTVNLVTTDTQDWTPGVYILTGYATKATERHVVSTTQLTVLPNPLSNLTTTHAQRTLSLIEAAIERRIPHGLENTVIDGQQLDRIPLTQLHSLRDKYRREVLAEQDAAGARAGIRRRRTIRFKFVSA